MLTIPMRDFLITHIDGPQLIRRHRGAQYHAILQSAIIRGLVRPEGYGCRPKRTFITHEGRELLAKALGNWADALVRAQDRPISEPGKFSRIGLTGLGK